MKTKFYLTLAAFIVSATVFALITFTHIFPDSTFYNFLQGFSGGLALGSFVIAIARGVRYKKATGAEIAP